MKVILLIFCLLNFISCFEYILKAGIKTEGHCENNNFVFQYDYNYFVNDLVPNFKSEFSLLIEEDEIDYIAQCEINQQNFFSYDFEILCTIENYFGCMSGSLDNPQYIIEEPSPIHLNDDNYLIFEGFMDANNPYWDEKNLINITITAGNIIEKYIENQDFVFKINYTWSKEEMEKDIDIDIDKYFNLSILDKNDDIINANCSFEELNITCKTPKSNVKNGNYSDINIIGNPSYIDLNGTTLFFQKFENLKTYSIRAGKIELGTCKNLSYYQFKIFNIRSSSRIPEGRELEIKVGNSTAKCPLKEITSAYSTNCIMNICPDYIELTNNQKEINTEIFSPDSLFYYDFNGKRTISVNAGKLIKGKCEKSNNENIQYRYTYTFINNSIDYTEEDKYLEFILYTTFRSNEQEEKLTICNINLSGFDNTSYCYLDLDECNEEDDIYIKQNVTKNYTSNLSPNSVFYSDFNNTNTITIKATNNSMIIKQEKKFIITNNIVQADVKSIDIIINTSISGEEESVQCNIPNIDKDKMFNITCEINSDIYSLEKDIKIVEEPKDNEYNYFFNGYKNKETRTLKAGKLIRDNNNNKSFLIINNSFSERIDSENRNISFDLEIQDGNRTKNSRCLFNISDINPENEINISCSTIDDLSNLDFISIMENPIPMKFNDTISLSFWDFEGKGTFAIKAGKINKGKCSVDSDNKKKYNFNITDNIYHYNIDTEVSFNLVLSLGEKETISICSLNLSRKNNSIICNLDDYCPDYFKINSDPDDDYYSIQPNITIKYEDFTNKGFYMIRMNDEGKIIKTDFTEDNYNFIISNNSFLSNLASDQEFYIIFNINDDNTFANCSIPKIKANEFFNISCYIIKDSFSFSFNDEIEIMEDPKDSNYFFTGYKNKKTLTLESGNIIKNIYDNRKFKLINNHFMSDTSIFPGEDVEIIFDIQYSENVINKTKCTFNMNDIINNYVNISCSLPDNVKEIKYISVMNNPELIIIDKYTTLNYFYFDNLNLYSVSLGNIIKYYSDRDDYNDIFYFANTTISSKTEENITLNISININNEDEEYISICKIINNKTLFNMECKIQDFIPISNYDISCKLNNYFVMKKYITIYIENAYISTTTLTSGYLIKESCDYPNYYFSIKNNLLSGNGEIKIGGEFYLSLKEFSSNSICIINPEENNDIKCSVELKENETDFCLNMNQDINVSSVIYDEYHYILINNNVLHLNSFENLATHTIEGGDIIRGICSDRNIYTFKIKNCLPYNNLVTENKINFNLYLSEPRELSVTCTLPKNITKHVIFDIECSSINSGDICPIYLPSDEILKIKNNPEDIKEQQTYFNNFTDLTTLISINGGNLIKSKYESDNKKYYFNIENSTSTFSLNENINFNLSIEVESNERLAKCSLNNNNLNISCEINEIDSESINIKIINNPSYDSESIQEKIIGFYNFTSKKISAVIAGKFTKGLCEQNIYKFTIKDSKSQYFFNQEFNLQLKEPKKLASCHMTNFDELNKICDIECSFDGESSCKSEYEGKELITGDINPESVRIDENNIVYFYSFEKKTTIVYEIKVGNLIKPSTIDTEESKYHFRFNNEPFSLPNFKEDILFKFNMSYNNSPVIANCELTKINAIQNSTVDLNCYFELTEEMKQRDDLLNYDLYIGEDINKNKIVVNSNQELNLIGFDNKETLTLLGKNIKNKYEENNKIYFVVGFDSAKEIAKDIAFEITFSNDTLKNNFKANCSYNTESKEIICEDTNNKINIDDNIIIKSMPDYRIINENQSLYFMNFQNIRTYTIKAGLIDKLDCPMESPYIFNLINTSSPNIPNDVTIEIPIFVNDNEFHKAKCHVQNSPRYNMSCEIENINCPKNIILYKKIEPNETLFSPHTTFFNDFNNKRTITIELGKIKKGECIQALSASDSQYHFNITDNKVDYHSDSVINFKLYIFFYFQLFTSYCYINISEVDDNTIYCHLIRCPISDDDLAVASKPENDYISMYPNSIFFENFTKNTTTIAMEDSGLIIKNQEGFIITQNYVKEKVAVSQFDINIKIKINGDDSKSSFCTIPKVNEKEIFNITCPISLSQEDEIEISEEPEDENYYFSGYKNKRTLTLKAGSLYKYNNENSFDIRNSNFNGEYPLVENFEFNMRCKYNEEKEEDTLCSLNTIGILNSDINIICRTSISNIKTVTILNNPDFVQLNKNITLYFTGFQNLNLYTLTPGFIIKGKCESNSFTFNLYNTDISKSLSNQIEVNIPLIINGETNIDSLCQIDQEVTKFNMSCIINDYCPENNIDIKIEEMHITDINAISPNSLYININSEIQTSTLNLGYLKKDDSCLNNNYTFSINNNFLSGKKIDNINSKFKLKLVQFNNEANCLLNSLSINCFITLNPEEEEYCTNLNKDIKIEELIGNENNYIILDNDNIILHLYGIDKLETYTIVGGELNQGIYKDNIYTFSLNNSLSYNDILSTTKYKFYLPLKRPNYINANCSLPSEIEKEKEFDINCEIDGNIDNYIIETRNENPQDIQYNTQYIAFREFENKNTEIKLTAGQLKLENSGPSNYYLNFTNSNINTDLNRDISFDIEIEINNEKKNITCDLYQNSKDIQCNLLKYTNKDINRIYIPNNPNNNLNIIKGKTLTFTNFANKEINTFIAGYIEKGGCDEDGINYLYYFRNCFTFIKRPGIEFNLLMTLPNSTGQCIIINNSPSLNLYDAKCTIKGESSCTEVNNTDFTVGEKEPETNIISDLNALYYLNFTGQSTVDNRTKYHFNGGILSKKSVVNSGGKALYTFNIEDCSLNIPLKEDYEFNILISLDIYDDFSNINYKGEAKCTIPKDISDINGTNIITECSFTTPDSSYYTNKENYDILIEEGNQINKIDEEHIIYISKLNGLTTVTMYGCQINKGQCDSNNKYTFNFDSCNIHKDISFSQDFEFNLKAKTGQNSICKINDKNSINCEIEEYSLCSQNNDIVIDNNEAQINKTKYPLYKNFYILGLKNLYTTSLYGGVINFGQCQSTNFVFNFPHTQLTNELSQNINFNLSINEPIKTISSCTIPKNSKEFDLQCVIKDETKCPISDPTTLKIEEITEEKILEFIRPNALYINNFININIIELKAGTMTVGQCNDKRYELYFNDSEIIGEIKGDITQDSLFNINLKYPSSYKLNCIIPKDIKSNSKFNLLCYIEGYSRCPIYDYTYIETSDNNPDVNESLIMPNVVKFSNFNNQKINLDNYYLELRSINWQCSEDIYNFNLTSKFNVNVTEKVTFNLNVTNNIEPKNLEYICSFSKDIKQGTNSLIICSMKEKTLLLNNNLSLNFDVIKLEGKNQYIINQGTTKRFINNNVQCPYVNIETNSTIIPSMNSTDKSIQFSMNINTSYINKEIKIYDNSTKQYKEYLELKLKPSTSIKYFYRFLSLSLGDSFNSKCDVPKSTTQSVQINCTAANITDTKSDTFETESNDIIVIEGNQFGIDTKKIKNPYKKEDGGDDDDKGKKGGISTGGKIVLIVFVVLVFAAIILALVYYFCFYKKKNNDTTDNSSNRNSNQQPNNHRPGGNQNSQNNQQNSQSNQSSSSEGSQQHSNQAGRKIRNRDEAFEY